MPTPIWALNLQPASYNGIVFHVEVSNRGGGRRVALHQFPKKEIPYAEDMGRRARSFAIVGYIVDENYEPLRDALIAELELEGNGNLVLPTSFDPKVVVVERFSVTERREQGGYVQFEMLFVEAGTDPSTQIGSDSQAQVSSTANSVSGGPNYAGPDFPTNTFMQSSDITVLT